jgi:superfamily I DNA/RNA helicase
MIALELDAEQRLGVEAPLRACVAITGSAGTGKSTALEQRIECARREDPHARPLVASAARGLETFAFDILERTGRSIRPIDDVDASLLFERACAPLFELAWQEFVTGEIDPEVPGLRAPHRFAESAFRLIRKLREACIEPAEFLERSLRGATQFYGKPPNFADPALLAATKDVYRSSLDVDSAELQRQYRREVDLAKILAKLYEGYLAGLAVEGLMTGRDAVAAAAGHLRADPALAAALRAKHRFAFIDDAQELTGAELALLIAVFGETLEGVTFCGDPSSAISAVRAGLPEAPFQKARHGVVLTRRHRSPGGLKIAPRRLPGPHEEAECIAEQVRAWLAAGTPPHRIAVLFRSIRNVEIYENALLERDIAVVTGGDLNVFGDRRALDAMALLWNVYDPFRHDWMLRTLSGRALALSDASLAILCNEPPNPQTPLFAPEYEPAPTERLGRWDPKRDLRLGWNVVRAEQDAALEEIPRRRLQRFRELRRGWIALMNASTFDRFARKVWSEGLAREGAPGSAKARAQQLVLRRLLDRLCKGIAARPDATVADVLAYAESRAHSPLESCEPIEGEPDCVRLLSVEAARGREFDFVAVGGACPGSFPLWYAPDAFLFSPRLGMIPKENCGGRASRTAKYTAYLFWAKVREGFNARERRAFEYALARARIGALVTASGSATRGSTAPEFLEELRAGRSAR